MKRFLFGVIALLLFGCAPQLSDMQAQSMDASMPKLASLPDLGPAPELMNDTWLNVDAPYHIADLRGKVVIVEMWTFGCINCQHVMPSLKEWHSKYKDQGLVIIGNHFPEFSYEADLANLKDAIAQNDIQYAVAQDNDGATWKAYRNNYWPALYLIDKQGHIRYVHIGEGRYKETEENIKALLEEPYQ
ncbi:MAG TPA: redoxin domain-containing protein [Anaerolineales bacterium]|nr:redoxin domain-containing protein [Anaerolineales bacterium]